MSWIPFQCVQLFCKNQILMHSILLQIWGRTCPRPVCPTMFCPVNVQTSPVSYSTSWLGLVLDLRLEALKTSWVTEILYCFLHAHITAVFSSMLYFFCLFRVLYTADGIPAYCTHFSRSCHTCGASQITSATFLWSARHSSQSVWFTWSPTENKTWCILRLLPHWSRVGMLVSDSLELTALGVKLPALKKCKGQASHCSSGAINAD